MLPRIFQKTQAQTQCDSCRVSFDLNHGGVCASCQRILCHEHLHGSWFRRLRVDLGARDVCVACRSNEGRVTRKA